MLRRSSAAAPVLLLLLAVAVAGCGGPAPSGPVSPPSHTEAAAPSAIVTAGVPTSQRHPFAPASMRLPSGAVVPLDPAGVDATGVLAVPVAVDRAGWWTGGARAGDPFGGIVVAGHVDSARLGIGAMAELNDVAKGARVVLAGAGGQRTYRVSTITQVPKARLSADLGVFDQVVPERLVLITCGGAFDPVARHYADNLVVVAEPVDARS